MEKGIFRRICILLIVARRTSVGSYLFICCEGNCGFYECGINRVPFGVGYSVLAWNHPGFCCSSGQPTPDQEAKAADAAMLFAVRRLGFPPEAIVAYGWSIGGYAATWLGMNYPSLRGLILDATFDSLTSVAGYRIPFPHCIWLLIRPIFNSVTFLDISGQVRSQKTILIVKRPFSPSCNSFRGR